MEAAKIVLFNNVIHLGDNLNMGFSKTGGGSSKVDYIIRYEFGELSGQLAKNPSYGSYIWDTGALESEMTGHVMDGTIYLDTYENDVLIGTTQEGFTVATKSILIPTFSASYVNLGESITVALKSSNWTYRPVTTNIGYKCGNTSGTIRLSPAGTLPTHWEADWTAPLNLGVEFPDQTSSYVEITVETEYYNIMNQTETILGAVTVRLEVRVPDNDNTKPDVSAEITPVSNLGADFDGMFIKGLTGLRADLTMTGKYGAGIAEYATTVQGVTVSENPAAFQNISISGTLIVSISATDTRGFTRTVSQYVQVLPYDKPSVIPFSGQSKVVCVRCLKDGTVNNKGEYVLIKAGRKFSSLSGANSCTLRYRYKAASAVDYSEWATILDEDAEGDGISIVPEGVILTAKTAYTFQIGVVDAVGNYANITIPVPGARRTFQLGEGGRNVSVGQFCDYSHEDAFDIAFTTYFNTGAAKQTVFSGGTWNAGEDLGTVVADADIASIGSYNLLIAVSGGIPVLCIKVGGVICGGDIVMTYTDDSGAGKLTLDKSTNPITALYKLL